MQSFEVRPATAADVDGARETFPDMQPDHWREGNNRRAFAAVTPDGQVLGHCRGIDNDFHPASRVYVHEELPDAPDGVADVLLEAQIAVSTVPLHVKPTATDHDLQALLRRHRGVVIQAMPPWRYVVGRSLRQWADAHRHTRDDLAAGGYEDSDRGAMLDLEVEHYIAQHEGWSPAAAPEVLRAEFSTDHVPPPEGAFDPARSVVLRREGAIIAQGLVIPEDLQDPSADVEVTLQAIPYSGPTARADKETCLAAVIDRSADGDPLCIDAHLTQGEEIAMMADIPGPPPHPDNVWSAIVAVPVPGGPDPTPLPAGLVPPDAPWLRDFLPS